MIEIIYTLFPYALLLGVAELILHLFKVSISGVSIPPRLYKKIIGDVNKLDVYHRRHLLALTFELPLFAIGSIKEFNPFIRVICLMVALVIFIYARYRDVLDNRY